MKTITRIVIILVAALIVVGITMAVANSSSNASTSSNFQEGQPPQIGDQAFVPGARPEGGGERGGGFGWLGHLLPIAGIVFVVVLIERSWGRIFKPLPAHVPVEK